MSDSENEDDPSPGHQRMPTPIPRRQDSPIKKRKFRPLHNPYSASAMKDDLGTRGFGGGGGRVNGMRGKMSGGLAKRRMII